MRSNPRLAGVALLALFAAPLCAQNRETPYWAAMRVDQANLRVGPSESYRISWVYKRKGLPVKVLRIKEGWRLVQDPDGTRGWIVARFLTPERHAYVRGPGLADMRAGAGAAAPLRWRLEPGVSGKLGDCDEGWCKLEVGAYNGFVEQSRLWGAGEP